MIAFGRPITLSMSWSVCCCLIDWTTSTSMSAEPEDRCQPGDEVQGASWDEGKGGTDSAQR